MHVETLWRDRAIRHFNELSPALQNAAITLEQHLIANPHIGEYSHEIRLEDGTQAYVHIYAGITVVMEFYRRGLFRKTTVIVIHDVSPMDLPGSEHHD